MSAYFPRMIDTSLVEWKNDPKHKPLLLRGARQVGKSTAVQHLAKQFKYYLEINFERQPKYKEIFEKDLVVTRIIAELSAFSGIPIISNETLVFFDEVQECQQAIMALRFFKEDFPSLHVIAAGSLLEFALEDIPTFGVGRIRSIFMFPMTFDEFLLAQNNSALVEMKAKATPQNPLPNVIHNRLVELFRTYIMVGGMPEVVSTWVETNDYLKCSRIQDDIVDTYETDFGKYRKRMDPQLLRATLHSVALQVGRKFVFSQVRGEYRSAQVKAALDRLQQAGLILPVTNTSGNGLPLSAEADNGFRKYLLIDSGLLLRIMKMELGDIQQVTEQILIATEKDLVNKGHLVEMVAGLEIFRYHHPLTVSNNELFYWQKPSKEGDAEIDYLEVFQQKILPIEVKAETQGGMKSLYAFMESKSIDDALRTSLENFSDYYNKEQHVMVVPLYAMSSLFR